MNRLIRALRLRKSQGLSTPEVLFATGLIIAVLGSGVMLIQDGSGNSASAAAANTDTVADPANTGAVADPDAAPESTPATARKRTTQSRLRALRHPLIGISRAQMIARLGQPTRRAIEGGPQLELVEYEIANHEYQLVLLDKRVVEVNRFG